MDTTRPQVEGRYLSFSVAREEFAVEIHRIREIVAPVVLEVLPGAASHIRGILRLRGKMVPVVDLRNRLGLEDKEARPGSCVLTVLAKGWSGTFLIGLLVDGIREVVQVWGEQFKALEETGYLVGRAFCEDREVLLLDVDRVGEGEEEAKYNLGGSHEAF